MQLPKEVEDEKREWYDQNLRVLRLLTEPVLDRVCEWLYQRYTANLQGDYDGLCRGWQHFEKRAPSIRKVDARSWEEFLEPHPKWRSIRNGEVAPNETVTGVTGPILEASVLSRDDAKTTYRVDIGVVYGPMAAEGGEIQVIVRSDGNVVCEATGSCWIA